MYFSVLQSHETPVLISACLSSSLAPAHTEMSLGSAPLPGDVWRAELSTQWVGWALREKTGRRNSSQKGQAPGSRDMGRDEEGFAPRNTMGRGIRATPCHHLQWRCLSQSEPVISSPTSVFKAVAVQSLSLRPHPS